MGELLSVEGQFLVKEPDQKVEVPFREMLYGRILPGIACVFSIGFAIQAFIWISPGPSQYALMGLFSLAWAVVILFFMGSVLVRESPEIRALKRVYGQDLPMARLVFGDGSFYPKELAGAYLVEIGEAEIRLIGRHRQLVVLRSGGAEVFVRKLSATGVSSAGFRDSELTVKTGEWLMTFTAQDEWKLFTAAQRAGVEVRE